MLTRFFQHPWGWTSAAPLLCAVHCLLTPVLIFTVPVLAVSSTLEWSFLMLTAVLAVPALISGLRTHGEAKVVGPIVLGLLLWAGSLLHVFHPLNEEVTTLLAALITATGLVWNSRLHCATGQESCTACEEGQAWEEAAGSGPAVESPLRTGS